MDMKKKQFTGFKLTALAVFTMVAAMVIVQHGGLEFSAKQPGMDREFDGYASKFHGLTGKLNDAETCLPMHVGNMNDMGLFYLHCSPLAVRANGEPRKVSESFSVPASVAQRFNFWKKVYGVFGTDQYVLHLSNYPEVVLEIADASTLPENLSEAERAKRVKKLLKAHRERYRPIFRAMHRYRNEVHKFTPTMQRIAAQMAHIDNPNKYNDAVWRMRLQRGQRDFIAAGIPRSHKYMGKIEKIFEEANIPVEISKLAFVESSFNLKARSKVGASGVYQIMPSTGKQYLMIRGGVDERNDPIKAAKAATKLLKLNYSILGEWPLAITAYNHGVGGIKRAVRRVGSSDINDLIQNYEGPAFGFASKNFFSSFLAVLDTLQSHHIYYPDAGQDQELNFVEHRLDGWLKVSTVAKRHGINVEEIAQYNPDILHSTIRQNQALPKGYVIKIPVTLPIAEDNKENKGESSEQDSRLIQHKEDRG